MMSRFITKNLPGDLIGHRGVPFLIRYLHPDGLKFPGKPATPVDTHQRAHLLMRQVDESPVAAAVHAI